MRKRMQALEGLDPFAAFGPGEGQRDYRSPEVRQKLEQAAEYQRQIEQYQQGLAKAAEDERKARRAAADDAVRRYEAERNKDPEYRLKQAEQELAKLARPQIGVKAAPQGQARDSWRRARWNHR
jgi:tRNA(Ile)-lysidine synthase TilS/MesJ